MVFNRLLGKYNIEYSKDDVIDLVNIYRSHKPNISLYDDAKEILNYLYRNYKLGLIKMVMR